SLHLPTVLQKEIALLGPIASLLPAVYEFPSFDLKPTEFIPQILKQIYISEFSFEELYRAVLRANLNNPSHSFIKSLHEQNMIEEFTREKFISFFLRHF
ncbi:hypothetical protein B9K06_26245, partial [Bacillus sp. OG2]